MAVISVNAQTITVSGEWALTITSADMTGEAGTDLTGQMFESATNQVNLDVKSRNNWRVDIELGDPLGTWPDTFILEAQVTSGSVTGGSVYQEVEPAPAQFFFSGRKNIKWIYVQYRLSNVSVTDGTGTFSCSIVYTVTDQ